MADITVNAGGNLQTALNNAAGATNDRIVCEAGAIFTGPFSLPTKTGGKVTITSSSVLSGALPVRPDTGDSGLLATITASAGSNWHMQAATNASNWTLDGLRFVPAGNGSGVIDFIGPTCANNTFSRLVFDGASAQQKRFLRADGVNNLIKHLYVHDLHKAGTDGQGISVVQGAGPHTIYHCYINGGSECILFGGGTSASAASNPQDIVVEHCELSQPAGRYPTTHLAKNLFELKNALRVKFRYNILRDITDSAQSATAIMLTPSNQQGDSPWSRVYDVEISHCRVSNVGRFLTVTGYGFTGDTYTEETKHLFSTLQTDLVSVRHIYVQTIADRFIQASGEIASMVVEHCTHLENTKADSIAVYLLDDATCLRTGGASGPQTYTLQSLTIKDSFIQGTVTSPLGNGVTGCTRSDVVRSFTTSNNVVGLASPGSWTTQYPGFTRESLATYDANFVSTTDATLVPGSSHNNTASDGTDKGWDLDDGAPTESSDGTPVAITWTSFTGGATAAANDLTGPGISSAISVQQLTGDGYIEWTDNTGTGEFYVGLGTNAAHDFLMSHAFEFGVGAHVRESNVYKGVSVTRTAGDVYRIEVTGTTVEYYHEGALIYTSLVAVSLPKKMDTAFQGVGGQIADAVMAQTIAENYPPTVNAGPDVSILTGGTASLSAVVVDDGNPSGNLTYTWSKVLGPGMVTFATPNALSTTATVSANGTYIVRLTASDGARSSYDDVMLMQTVPNVPTVRPTPRIFVGNTEITTRVRVN